MKKYNIKITPYANQQMVEIRDYIAYNLMNPQAARDFLTEVRTETGKLDQLPDRIKPVEEEPWKSEGIRKISVKNFYAYYWIDEDNSAVHVIAVAYKKRDQKQVLENLDT